MRLYDLNKLIEKEYFVVDFEEPLYVPYLGFDDSDEPMDIMKKIQEWADERVKGDYILLLKSIICEYESDAVLFKLKYG